MRLSCCSGRLIGGTAVRRYEQLCRYEYCLNSLCLAAAVGGPVGGAAVGRYDGGAVCGRHDARRARGRARQDAAARPGRRSRCPPRPPLSCWDSSYGLGLKLTGAANVIWQLVLLCYKVALVIPCHLPAPVYFAVESLWVLARMFLHKQCQVNGTLHRCHSWIRHCFVCETLLQTCSSQWPRLPPLRRCSYFPSLIPTFRGSIHLIPNHDITRKSYIVLCWTGATAAAALGSAPAAGGGGASGGGMSRTVIIIIAVCATVVGLAVIAVVVVVVAYARRHQEDLPEQETSVAMSGASGGVRHWATNMLGNCTYREISRGGLVIDYLNFYTWSMPLGHQ